MTSYILVLQVQQKKKFEELLSTIGSVDFMGQVTHFLGIEVLDLRGIITLMAM
jgi:hypothetical protein